VYIISLNFQSVNLVKNCNFYIKKATFRKFFFIPDVITLKLQSKNEKYF